MYTHAHQKKKIRGGGGQWSGIVLMHIKCLKGNNTTGDTYTTTTKNLVRRKLCLVLVRLITLIASLAGLFFLFNDVSVFFLGGGVLWLGTNKKERKGVGVVPPLFFFLVHPSSLLVLLIV